MTEAALRALLALRALPGVGDVRRRALLAKHRTPRAALRAALATGNSVDRHALEGTVSRIRDATVAAGAHTIALFEPGYPRALRRLRNAPTVLWARGNLELLETPAVAIVGTRRNTEYGADVARRLAADLARAGVTIVSGLAHGIDRHAHQATLDAGGSTIAIIGSGIDVVYPHAHARLHERIARAGLLLSEFLPGEPALRHHFPRRNRLIAALSLGVIVVEAPERSGALNTAHHALELHREVFAVPGPIGRETSVGTNALIRDGARLVMDAGDVMEELRLVPAPPAARRQGNATLQESTDPQDAAAGIDAAVICAVDAEARYGVGAEADAVLRALDGEPRHADDIAVRCGLPAASVSAILLGLELNGAVRQVPGARFVRPLAA